MVLKVDEKTVATARSSRHAAADGNGAWIVSVHEAPVPLRPGDHGPVAARLASGAVMTTRTSMASTWSGPPPTSSGCRAKPTPAP
jgi:hypothetical protein